MKIAVGSDHAGFENPPPHAKPAIIDHLRNGDHEIVDCGTEGPEPVDYPEFANRVSRAVLNGDADVGVLICGSGVGMAMVANRHPGIRAANCTTIEIARLSREHNHANVVCLSTRLKPLRENLAILDAWLAEPWSDADRHKRRVAAIG